MAEKITLEMVSDIVCPWCWLGLRRLKTAIDLVPEVEVEVMFRPYQLDPGVPDGGMDYKTYMKGKFGADSDDQADKQAKAASKNRWMQMRTALEEYGAAEGIPFDFEHMTIRPNTTNAHRLVYWAQGRYKAMIAKEALFEAYFKDHRDIGDVAVLADIADEIGLDRSIVSDLFTGDADKDVVAAEANLFVQMGVRGVPCFIGNRKVAVQGADSAEKLAELIRTTAQKSS